MSHDRADDRARTMLTRTRLTRRQALQGAAGLGLALPAFATLGGFASAQGTPKSGGTLKMGMQADPAQLDPQITQLTAAWHVIEHVYDTLIRPNEKLEPVPALATEWSTSADGLTLTFKLRDGVKWHNGRTFTSDDVKYTYERVIDPKTASPYVSDFDNVAKVETPDPLTVVFAMKAPDSSFLSKLMGQSLYVVPKEVVEKEGDLMQTMVGTGPFKFVEYIPNTSVKLEKNPDYWEPGKPYLDGIEMQIVSDDTQRSTALETNTVDFIEYAPVKDLERLKGDSSLAIAGDQNTNIRYMAINVAKPPFDKPEVRQAISMAIDRKPIIESAVFGYGTPTNIVFPATYWAGFKSDIPAADIDGAKALLAKAGATGLKCKIQSWAQYAFLSNAAIVIQEQLKQIGINAEMDLQENATLLDNYFKGNFDLSVTGTSAYVDPNDVIQGNFGTGESSNGMKYSNPKVDDLIKQGTTETDIRKRAEVYVQIQKILLEDLPWVNLFIANQYEAMKNYVKGYVHIPTGSNISIKEAWLDK